MSVNSVFQIRPSTPLAIRDHFGVSTRTPRVTHVHQFVMPVFTERKPDQQPILTDMRCHCGAILARGV